MVLLVEPELERIALPKGSAAVGHEEHPDSSVYLVLVWKF
jgi:hypothetical protein